MVDLDERAVDALQQRGEYLLVTEFVEYVERFHDGDGDTAGVSGETLAAYARDLEAEGSIDAVELLDAVTAAASESGTWVDGDTVYRVNSGRLSRYPRRWHGALGASEDVVAFLRFLQADAEGYGPIERGASGGVPEDDLLDVVATVGALDREQAKRRLEARGEAGDVIEDADQHPAANVYLTA